MYKVHKIKADGRLNTCGFFLPNGGYYHVVEMTFENAKQLQDISQKPGYSVDFCTGPEGFFFKDGAECDLEQLKAHFTGKWDRPPRDVPMPEKGTKRRHKCVERSDTVEQARSYGIRAEAWASTQKLKELIRLKGRAAQDSLAIR